jgi:hypothetical protein
VAASSSSLDDVKAISLVANLLNPIGYWDVGIVANLMM